MNVFNFEKEKSVTYKVRDGEVGVGDYVWWHCEGGPMRLKVTEYEPNLRDYPEFHSIEKPVFVQHPAIEWKVVYEHEEGFKHIREGREVVKTKHERKRPEFTSEDGITLFYFSLKHCTPYSKMLVQLDKHFVDDLIVALTEEPTGEEQTRFVISEIDKFLRVTRVFQQSYKNKEFRKKLKLYIKWLQSEMSRQESSK